MRSCRKCRARGFFCRFLRAVRGSGLIERFAKSGLKKERVEFVGMQGWEGYIECLSRLDVALDPFPYGGGITSCDALWMGVPVLTLYGGRLSVGRGGRSILSNIGLPGVSRGDGRKYVEIAVALANDLPRLSEMRSTLRERMERSPLRDAKRHARDIEAAFREMWRQWCGKQKPHDFDGIHRPLYGNSDHALSGGPSRGGGESVRKNPRDSAGSWQCLVASINHRASGR